MFKCSLCGSEDIIHEFQRRWFCNHCKWNGVVDNKIWVRMRSDGDYVVLEVEYDGGEYIELARELKNGPFSHESRVLPIADRKGIKP